MLTGSALGAAIEDARKKKGITKKALANHFGLQPPSIQDWVKRGTIDKQHLPGLWALFADVAGPEHWGLDQLPPITASQAQAIAQEAGTVSPPTATTIEQAIEALGIALAVDMPDDVREDLADALSKLAKRRGLERLQEDVLRLLRPVPGAANRTGT